MRAALAEAGGDPVVLGDDVGDLHPVVGEGVAHHVDDELDALGAERQARRARARRPRGWKISSATARLPLFQTSSMNRSMSAWFASRVDGAPVRCRSRGPAAGGAAGTTPSCCIRPSMSMLIQPSTSLPSFSRNSRVPLQCDRFARRRDAHEAALVVPLADAPPDDEVALGDDVGEVEHEVRERLVEGLVGPLEALAAGRLAGDRLVLDVVLDDPVVELVELELVRRVDERA